MTDLGALSGSHPTGQAELHRLGASRFDPERVASRLRRIQALAKEPGKYTGPVFDEIWALADSCLSTITGGYHHGDV